MNGLLAPEGADEASVQAALREAFERLLADAALRERFGRASRHRAESEFAWDRIARRMVDVYRRHLGASTESAPAPATPRSTA